MREIRFRGKRVANGKWVDEPFYLYDATRGRHILTDGLLDIVEVLKETLGMFTGRKDRNGKDIYEGDIVKVVSLDTSSFGETKIAVIVYDEEMCCFDFKGADRQRCMCVSIPDVEIMIIGNIWDNPGLIPYKDKQQ